MNLPIIPKELLEALDQMYPERCPDPRADDREIWMAVGRRQVVRVLKEHYDRQNRNILETPLVQNQDA